ncbi:hypothetical protein NFJ02_16g24200 [Pycnococcus provasolii]
MHKRCTRVACRRHDRRTLLLLCVTFTGMMMMFMASHASSGSSSHFSSVAVALNPGVCEFSPVFQKYTILCRENDDGEHESRLAPSTNTDNRHAEESASASAAAASCNCLHLTNFDPGAGFFASVVQVFNQLLFAEYHKLKPRVRWENKHYGYPAHKGENNEFATLWGRRRTTARSRRRNSGDFWTAFFLPVGDDDEHAPVPTCCKRVDEGTFWAIHLNNRPPPEQYITTYTYSKEANDPRREHYPANLYDTNRKLAAGILDRHVRLRASSVSYALNLLREHDAWRSRNVVGVHLRGTDKAWGGEVLGPAHYFPAVDAYLANRGGKGAAIYVASDTRDFVHAFRRRYESRGVAVLTSENVRDATTTTTTTCGSFLARRMPRSSNLRANSEFGNRLLDVGLQGGGGGGDAARLEQYQNSLWRSYGVRMDRFKALCVLTDALMLAHADFLVKCSSAVGEFAIYLNSEHLGRHSLDLQYRCGHHGTSAQELGMVDEKGCVSRGGAGAAATTE